MSHFVLHSYTASSSPVLPTIHRWRLENAFNLPLAFNFQFSFDGKELMAVAVRYAPKRWREIGGDYPQEWDTLLLWREAWADSNNTMHSLPLGDFMEACAGLGINDIDGNTSLIPWNVTFAEDDRQDWLQKNHSILTAWLAIAGMDNAPQEVANFLGELYLLAQEARAQWCNIRVP